jgi:hypothetical protein
VTRVLSLVIDATREVGTQAGIYIVAKNTSRKYGLASPGSGCARQTAEQEHTPPELEPCVSLHPRKN